MENNSPSYLTHFRADTDILRKVYTGAVRPIMPHTPGAPLQIPTRAGWKKAQYVALRAIVGAMKTTPIKETEKRADLEPLDLLQNYSIWRQQSLGSLLAPPPPPIAADDRQATGNDLACSAVPFKLKSKNYSPPPPPPPKKKKKKKNGKKRKADFCFKIMIACTAQ